VYPVDEEDRPVQGEVEQQSRSAGLSHAPEAPPRVDVERAGLSAEPSQAPQYPPEPTALRQRFVRHPAIRPAVQALTNAFSSLTIRDYRLLFQGNFVTQTGFWMQQVVFGWLILELSNNAFYLGLASFFRAVPIVAVSPFGGVLADRVDRRRLMMSTQICMMLVAVTMAVLVMTGHAQVWHFLVASLASGVSTALQVPNRQALVAQLVGRQHLANAIALHSVSLNTSRIIGPSLAGMLLSLTGGAGALFLQALGYVWAVSNVARIRLPPAPQRAAQSSFLSSLIEGWRYCYRTRPLLMQILIGAVPSIFAMPYMQLLPAFARDVLRTGPEGLGLLFSAMGIGALAGSFGLASMGHVPRKGLLVLLSAAAWGGLLCLFALSRVHWLAAVLLALAGASSAVYSALNSTIVQELAPDDLRGRVNSVYMLTFGLSPLGTLPAGAIAQAYGVQVALFLGGAAALLFALAMLLFSPSARRVQ